MHTIAWKACTEPFPSHQWDSLCLTTLSLLEWCQGCHLYSTHETQSKTDCGFFCDCYAMQHHNSLNTWTEQKVWSCKKMSVHLCPCLPMHRCSILGNFKHYQQITYHRDKNAPDRCGRGSHVMTRLLFWIHIPMFINFNEYAIYHWRIGFCTPNTDLTCHAAEKTEGEKKARTFSVEIKRLQST